MPGNLWGELPAVGLVSVPAKIMQEQADYLTHLTGGSIRGKVEKDTFAENLIVRLSLVVPALNGYSYTLIEVWGPMIGVYPVDVNFAPTGKKVQARDEEEFTARLSDLLSSDETRRIISGLLAQVA